MSYWTETDDYLQSHGGKPPTCTCGRTMFAADDHGRFACFCGGGIDTVTGLDLPEPRPIPQVDVSGMSNEQKAAIPAINRLHQPPTEAEAKFFKAAAGGPDAMDDPEYWVAGRAIEEERRKAGGGS